MAVLFTDSFKRSFNVFPLSRSAIIFYFFMALAFIMPIVLVVKTHNFWVKSSTYTEQPDVAHLQEMLVLLHTTEGVKTISMSENFKSTDSPTFSVDY
jgi:hypothetical protein